MKSEITRITGRRVWDSRGRPTVEAEVELKDSSIAHAIAPAGASTGSGEAVDLRDQTGPFAGHEVTSAVRNVNGPIADRLRGMDAFDQSALDAALVELDGTSNKSRLGGNAAIAVSMAVLKASSKCASQPLYEYLAAGRTVRIPVPMIQIFGGGAHAGRRVDIQDFLVMSPSAATFAEALDRAARVYRAAGKLLQTSDRMFGVADEGGWWPAFDTNEAALELLTRSIEASGLVPGKDVFIALDIAASEFGKGGRYRLGLEQRELDRYGLAEMLLSWVKRYPVLSIEDPFAEDDPDGFATFTAAVRGRVQVVGDDLLVTNAARIEKAKQQGLVSCVLIKPNQAGTISETAAALEAGRSVGVATIVSARSGESEDTTIADLSVGWNAGQLKVGSMARGERTAKWNRMLRIEERLGTRARFAGLGALKLT